MAAASSCGPDARVATWQCGHTRTPAASREWIRRATSACGPPSRPRSALRATDQPRRPSRGRSAIAHDPRDRPRFCSQDGCMAWRITSRRRHETRSPAPAIVLRYQAGNVILGAWDNASVCHPETRSSASRMAVYSAVVKRETRRAESRLVKREMRREGSLFKAASSRHGGGIVAVWLGLQGVPGGGSPARWYEQLCGVRGRCAAVPERTVALQELTLRWQPVPPQAGPQSG